MNTDRIALVPMAMPQPTDGSLSRLGGIFERGAALLVFSALGNGMNFLFMMFLARQLGMQDFGLYALGLTIFNTVLLLVTTGIDTGAVKFTAEYQAVGDHSMARRMVSAISLVGGVIGVVACAGLAGASWLLANEVYHKPGLTLALLGFAAAIPCALMTALLLSTLQACHTVRYTVLIKYIWEPVGKWSLAAIALVAGWGLAGVVGALVVTMIVSAALTVLALLRVANVSCKDLRAVQQQDVAVLGSYCLPLLLANLFGVLGPRTDVMVLGYWLPSEAVGVYLAAFQTAAMLALVLGAFDLVFAPMMSRAWAVKDERTVRECYEAVHRIAVMVSIPLFTLLVVFGGEVLALFGPGFSAGVTALSVLAFGYLFNSASGCANTVLLMTGRSRLVLVNTIFYGTVLMAATCLLIPVWGLLGAALSASLCSIGLNVLRVWQVWRLHRMVPWTVGMVKPVAAGAAMMAALWLLKPWVSPVFYLPMGAAGCVFYLAMLCAARLEADDRLIVAETLSKLRLA